jgi:molybdenum cofactor synthesis domain-containing protein
VSSQRSVFKRLLEVNEAVMNVFKEIRYSLLRRVLHFVEEKDIYDIRGRLIGEDIEAPRSLPWYPRSLVDGCAVRSSDVQGAFEDRPVNLKNIGRIKIGERPDPRTHIVTPGTCIEVDTGAWVPRGADAVVPVEYYIIDGNRVLIERAVTPGSNIAMPASDVSEGDIVITKGTPTNSYLASILASLGLRKVKVSRKIKVGIISTGDELIEPGTSLKTSWDPHIYDSNRAYLINEIKGWGWDVIDQGIIPDDMDLIKTAILTLIEKYDVDLVISSGGTSAGIEDYVYKAINRLGKVIIHGLRLKPGKPTVVGIIKDRLIIGLPGNPRSCINVMNKFVKPLLTSLGLLWPEESIAELKARILIPTSGERGRRTFLPVAIIGNPLFGNSYALPTAKESYMIGSLAASDGTIVVSEHRAEPLKPLEEVSVSINRLPPCTLMLLSDVSREILNRSIDILREKGCEYLKVVASPMSSYENLDFLNNVYVLIRKSLFKDANKNIKIISEFETPLYLCKYPHIECQRLSLPIAFSDLIKDIRRLNYINSKTIVVSVPRIKSSEILFENGYVECALVMSKPKAASNCTLFKREKIILAELS